MNTHVAILYMYMYVFWLNRGQFYKAKNTTQQFSLLGKKLVGYHRCHNNVNLYVILVGYLFLLSNTLFVLTGLMKLSPGGSHLCPVPCIHYQQLNVCIKPYNRCDTKMCAFRCLISGPQIQNLRSQNQIQGKLLLSRKLLHFRGIRFSQCFILPTSPNYLLPSKVLC